MCERSAADHRHVDRQNVAQPAVVDELSDVRERRVVASLKANNGDNSIRFGGSSHLLCFLHRRSERPFAVHILSGFQERHHDRVVVRHPDRNGDEVDVGLCGEFAHVVIRPGNPVGLGRSGSRGRRAGAQRNEFELFHGSDRRHVCCRAPAPAAGVRTDQSNPQLAVHVRHHPSPLDGSPAPAPTIRSV